MMYINLCKKYNVKKTITSQEFCLQTYGISRGQVDSKCQVDLIDTQSNVNGE